MKEETLSYHIVYALFVNWVCDFIMLIECIVGIICFGFYRPYWSLDYCEWSLTKMGRVFRGK